MSTSKILVTLSISQYIQVLSGNKILSLSLLTHTFEHFQSVLKSLKQSLTYIRIPLKHMTKLYNKKYNLICVNMSD